MNSTCANVLLASVYTGRRARILIADDHILIAEACRAMLEPEFEVVGIVPNGRMLLEWGAELRPDVVIFEICMPGVGGLEAGAEIKRMRRSTKLIYLTATSDIEMAADEAEEANDLLQLAGATQLNPIRQHLFHDPKTARCLRNALARFHQTYRFQLD